LFQPFTQFDSRLSRQHSGTGLGLSLVLNMATLHGGGVEVKSRPGQGSCFTISLPWSGNASPSPTPQNRPAPEDGPLPAQHHDSPERVARILITEDNESNAMMLSDFLSSRGYEVAIARSGLESLRLIRELKPDLVLMDVQMPGMDGLEVMRRIRSQEGLARIPIIAITALAMPGDRERCLSAGADGYLTKPLELAELARFIGRCL
jgi:CheY-like chemotaxis protein